MIQTSICRCKILIFGVAVPKRTGTGILSTVASHAGEWRSEMTARIPVEDLPKDVKLSVGDNVRLSNGTNAIVRESTAESVLLDFNHPMAGKALTFEVELLKLTKVS